MEYTVSLRDVLKDFFTQNLDIVFLVYGLSFVIMGIAILAQPRRESAFKLSDVIWILAYFGIMHGINEWLHMFSEGYSSHGSYSLIVMHFILLSISYLFLFEFGRKLLLLSFNKKVLGEWITIFFCACTMVPAFIIKEDWSIWSSYFMGLPGGILSAFGFIWYYHRNKAALTQINVRRYFIIAAVSMGIYGILGGVIVPKSAFFPASVINTEAFLNLFGIPAQVFRAVCAIILAWAIWNILGIFNWELRQKLTTSLEEISAAKSNLDSIINSMTDSLVIIDLDGKIKGVNPATLTLLGYGKEEIVGMPASAIFMGEDGFFKGVKFKEIIERGSISNYEMVCRTKNGNLIPALFSASRIMDERGKLEGLVGIAKDITERKHSEMELRSAYNQLKIYQSHLIEAEKMDTVGRLASGVAHEVKNPLAIILQGIEYLSTMISSDNKDVAFALRSINDAIIRADKVVKGLLDFSTISEINMAQENLNSVIESALVLVKNYTLRHKIELIADLDKEVPSVDIDRNRIEQVLVNLFINAIDAMPDGGQLEIITYAKKLTTPGEDIGIRKEDTFKLGETVVIAEVKDSGSGMPEDVLRKIFDPFFTTKRSRGGTGLGLSIARNIMDMHGGKIKIENRKDARGVKATLTFKTKSEETSYKEKKQDV